MQLPLYVGRYELLTLLGEGGMGQVFAARLRGESHFERLYAIKRIRPAWAIDERFVTRFFDEARTAACIHSAFVVPVLDVGRDDEGVPFMAMGLVLGTDLSGLIAHGSMTPAMGLAVLLDATRGLRDAHITTDPYGQPLRIVHRDVNARNILVGVDGRARLTDFGLAKAARRGAVTAPGEVIGSYAYFSPEHLTGTADTQSDVYSLGIVAWEVFTGQRLFTERVPSKLIHDIASAPIPDVHEKVAGFPKDLSSVITRALKRDRSKRWRRAEDFLRALEQVELDPAPPDEVAIPVRELAQPLMLELRELGNAGVRAAKSLLAEVDTLIEVSREELGLTRHVVAGGFADDDARTHQDHLTIPFPKPDIDD